MIDEDDDLDTDQGVDDDTESSADAADGSSSDGGSPSTSSQPMNPVLRRYLENKAQLGQAQQAAGQNEMLTGLARAGASLSAGLSHSNAPVNEAPFNAMAVADQQPVTNVLAFQKGQAADIANQKALIDAEKDDQDHDPSSPQSLAAQNQIKRLYPGRYDDDTLNTLSAADIQNSILKPLELDQKIREHQDEMKNKAADRASSAADRAASKAQADQSKATNYVVDKLEAARSDQGVKQAQVDLYSTKKINSLINMYGDPNQLSMSQVRLLAQEVAKVAQGGVPGEHELDGITPNTLSGRMSQYVSDFINKPTSANAKAFVDQFRQYSDAIAGDARSVIKGKVDSIINIKRKDLGEDNFQNVRSNYYTRFGLSDDLGGNSSTGGTSAGNDHASRAADILARRRAAQSAQSPAIPIPNYANPGAPTGKPSLLLPSRDPASTDADQGNNYAAGGMVRAPQPPGYQHLRQNYLTPKLPAPKMPKAPRAPGVVMPAGMQPMTRAAHFADGGEVPVGMPDPDKARGAYEGAQHGEMDRLKYLLGLGEDPEKHSPAPARNYAHGGMATCYACGGSVHDYREGGQVPGSPIVPYNSTKNDIVPAKLSPTEIVLPISVTQSKDPALAAYLFVKQEMAKKNG